MSNLSDRVKKAKKLTWSHSPRNPGHYGTWGSSNDKYYNVDLSHSKVIFNTLDGKKSIVVLEVTCKQDTGILCDCPGNRHHTVCYHGLGALHESFKKNGKLISFFLTYGAALQCRFSGKIVKVQSLQGKGFLWAVIKEWPEKKELIMVLPKTILSTQENINLMRGLEDDEGID